MRLLSIDCGRLACLDISGGLDVIGRTNFSRLQLDWLRNLSSTKCVKLSQDPGEQNLQKWAANEGEEDKPILARQEKEGRDGKDRTKLRALRLPGRGKAASDMHKRLATLGRRLDE